jgi:hypothetical protein
MRICKTCKRELPLDDFYPKKECKGGRLPNCKACVLEKQESYRERHIERIRTYDRVRGRSKERLARSSEYRRRNRAKVNAISYAWSRRNLDKKRAHTAVQEAIADGRLVRGKCWCGSAEVEAHHPDYSRHLHVVWLCAKHHKQIHRKYQDEEGTAA